MALEHPVYAYAGALGVPIALGATVAAVRGPMPMGRATLTNTLILGSAAGVAALVAYNYARKPNVSTEARSFAEGAAITTGAAALLIGLGGLLQLGGR